MVNKGVLVRKSGEKPAAAKGSSKGEGKGSSKGKGKGSSKDKGGGKGSSKGKGKGEGPKGNSKGKGGGKGISKGNSKGKGKSSSTTSSAKPSSSSNIDPETGLKKRKVKPGSFPTFELHPNLQRAILKLGFEMPTPIQNKTMKHALAGRDVIGMARTGSGKTLAFLLPTLTKLNMEHCQTVGIRAVCLQPTRELALQSVKVARQLCRYGSAVGDSPTDLRFCLLVGGQNMETQFNKLAENPDMIFATPGRLVHHMVEAELSLTRVQTLIFDEADRMFELNFAEQLQKVLDSRILFFSGSVF